MPAPNDPQLIEFENWTLRVQPAKGKEPRLLLLIHGLTGDENSMWVFVRNFPEEYWRISPHASFKAEHPNVGYSWKASQPNNVVSHNEAPGKITMEDLRPAALDLVSLIDSFSEENNIMSTHFDVIGFSQGGALAYTLAVLHPERIRRAAILAGFFPANSGTITDDQPLRGKPFFVAHGKLDEMVKIEYARHAAKILEKLGADVTYCEDEVGHKVSARCLRALEAFFAI